MKLTTLRALEAAALVVEHHDRGNNPFWRRVVDHHGEPHLIDLTHRFLEALSDLPVSDLTTADLAALRESIEEVVGRLERRIEVLPNPDDTVPLSTAIYAIRARFEQIWITGSHTHGKAPL